MFDFDLGFYVGLYCVDFSDGGIFHRWAARDAINLSHLFWSFYFMIGCNRGPSVLGNWSLGTSFALFSFVGFILIVFGTSLLHFFGM